MNAGANEALPLFLDRLVPTWASVIISVTFVLIFGEIIPSAIFTVRALCT
jgi:CBS domain containing-hemolysin-like protein